MSLSAAASGRPLKPLEAYAALEEYAAGFGRTALTPAMHAAVAERLRPDLLDLIKRNFVPEGRGDLAVEADVLFAPFVQPEGGSYYRMEAEIRRQLLALLEGVHRHEAMRRSARVARFLLVYLDRLQHAAAGRDPLARRYVEVERWSALAFVDSALAARRFAECLKGAAENAEVAARVRFGGVAAAVSIPLAGFQDLLAYAEGLDALTTGDAHEAQRLLGPLGSREVRLGDVVLQPASELLARRFVPMTEEGEALAAAFRGPLILHGHEGPVGTAAFSPDGRRVVTASADHTARLWDAATGEELVVLRGHEDCANSAAFSPDGRRLVTASDDGTVRLWDVPIELARADPTDSDAQRSRYLNPILFSPDGRRVVTTSNDSAVWLWDTETGSSHLIRSGHEGQVLPVSFSPNGELIVTAGQDATIRLWDVSQDKSRMVLRGHQGEVHAASFSPDGHQLISAGRDGTVRLWDVETGRIRHILRGHKGWVWTAVFSPDGRLIASGGQDETVRLWDVKGGQERAAFHGHRGWVRTVAFAPDNRIVSGGEDGTLRLWNMVSREAEGVFHGHDGGVRSISFSASGRLLVSSGRDGTVRLWDFAAGGERPKSVLRGHEGLVWCAAFSSDERQIVSAGADNTARLWDVNSGELLRVFHPTAAGHLFLSHAHADYGLARRVADLLQLHGWEVWYSSNLPAQAVSFDSRLRTALEGSSCVIALISSTALHSEVLQSRNGLR